MGGDEERVAGRAATAGSALAASAAYPGTSSGQRDRPITCTTAAAMPTGTATRIARWFGEPADTDGDRGEQRRGQGEHANQTGHGGLRLAERGEDLLGRLFQDVGVVEHRAEHGERGVGERRQRR